MAVKQRGRTEKMAKALLGTWCREALGRWGWDGTGWDVPGFRMALARPWDRSRAGVVAQTCSVLPPAAEMADSWKPDL